MITNGQKTSLLVPYQLPEFIRDNPEYSNFVLFLQAYYEWMEENGQVTDRSKNLLNYKDIDSTTEEFTQYFYNDFLQYFPVEILANKKEVLKIAKELYQAKGTPAAFQFFFRTLYNSDVDFFYTKDAVLKASSGKWYISKSLKLSSSDLNFLETQNLRIFGESTKSIATIENAALSKNKIEVFISNIERLFQSGEFVRVVDNNNQEVYFKNGKQVSANTAGAETLRAKIVGQISQVKVSPMLRGQLYQGANTSLGYPGDPIVFFGGLNSDAGLGAEAFIETTTKGSIQRISVANTAVPGTNTTVLLGGFGYSTQDSANNNYSVINILNGGGAVANISGVNTATSVVVGNSFYNPVSTVTNIPTDRIGLFFLTPLGVTANNKNYTWNGTQKYPAFPNNTDANATTTLANAFSFISFSAYPISAVTVLNQGGGLTAAPIVTAQSLYKTTDGVSTADLGSLGILGPISVDAKGTGYAANDKIIITGGTGYGAYANVKTVAANGAITSVSYVYSSSTAFPLPLGGLGYSLTNLPTLSIVSANGANARLSVTGIVGQGAKLIATTDRVGSITSISVTNYGEDYISPPNVSFKVQDIVVTNALVGNFPTRGDLIYQGGSVGNSSYLATVDSLNLLQGNADPAKSLYTLRVYNYNSKPNIALPIYANNRTYELQITDSYGPTIISLYGGLNSSRYANGVINYGDGTAKGNATFLNGLTLGGGQYLDSTGQPSSFDVLQNENYNNYTYQITLEKEIAKYRTALLNLLHPTGMKVIGRFAMKSNNKVTATMVDSLDTGHTLSYYTSSNDSTAIISSNGDFTKLSSNVVSFTNLFGADISTFIFSNSTIKFTSSDNEGLTSEVASINVASNTVTLKNNTWLTIANVASGTGSAGGNTINIANVYTASFNIVNNGVYSNNSYPLKDIIHAGDFIKVNNMVKLVTSVNYTSKLITVNSNFTYAATGNISLNRVITASDSYVIIMGPVGAQYFPQLVTEAGDYIITEDGNTILIS
jgi:hypothetical protein